MGEKMKKISGVKKAVRQAKKREKAAPRKVVREMGIKGPEKGPRSKGAELQNWVEGRS